MSVFEKSVKNLKKYQAGFIVEILPILLLVIFSGTLFVITRQVQTSNEDVRSLAAGKKNCPSPMRYCGATNSCAFPLDCAKKSQVAQQASSANNNSSSTPTHATATTNNRILTDMAVTPPTENNTATPNTTTPQPYSSEGFVGGNDTRNVQMGSNSYYGATAGYYNFTAPTPTVNGTKSLAYAAGTTDKTSNAVGSVTTSTKKDSAGNTLQTTAITLNGKTTTTTTVDYIAASSNTPNIGKSCEPGGPSYIACGTGLTCVDNTCVPVPTTPPSPIPSIVPTVTTTPSLTPTSAPIITPTVSPSPFPSPSPSPIPSPTGTVNQQNQPSCIFTPGLTCPGDEIKVSNFGFCTCLPSRADQAAMTSQYNSLAVNPTGKSLGSTCASPGDCQSGNCANSYTGSDGSSNFIPGSSKCVYSVHDQQLFQDQASNRDTQTVAYTMAGLSILAAPGAANSLAGSYTTASQYAASQIGATYVAIPASQPILAGATTLATGYATYKCISSGDAGSPECQSVITDGLLDPAEVASGLTENTKTMIEKGFTPASDYLAVKTGMASLTFDEGLGALPGELPQDIAPPIVNNEELIAPKMEPMLNAVADQAKDQLNTTMQTPPTNLPSTSLISNPTVLTTTNQANAPGIVTIPSQTTIPQIANTGQQQITSSLPNVTANTATLYGIEVSQEAPGTGALQ